MEHLSVEVVGDIRSHLRAAHDVVVASATCKKWREAFQYYLHSLTFFDELTIDDVLPELMHTRDTLCELHLYANIYPTIKILEKCNGHKLEVLELAYIYISSEECSYQKFPRLKTLRLEYVVSLLDLNILLILCPKIENLTLVDLGIHLGSPPQTSWVLSTVSLKTENVSELYLDKFILEADGLECLHLLVCNFGHFELAGKGALKVLNMDAARISYFNIGDVENLEIVDVNDCTIKGPKLYNMISKSSNLRRLQLWHVKFNNADEVIDLEGISASFPRLTRLSLHYDVEETLFSLQGSYHLQNVALLEIGCAIYLGMDCRCHREMSQLEEISHLQIARKYPQVEFRFEDE
ncbi:hypothetical protein SLA2020_352880 [Shorea laevis]